MSRDTKCCDFATISKMKNEVLPIISNIFYTWYLQKFKSIYSGVHQNDEHVGKMQDLDLESLLRAQYVKKRRESS